MRYSSNTLSEQLDHEEQQHSRARADASVLADIYQEEVNIAVWQNQLPASLRNSVDTLLSNSGQIKAVMTVTPENVVNSLREHSTELKKREEYCQYVGLLVDMFCTLFELNRVGLRLTQLDRAMCPKFHVDRVPCRLITTFAGVATQWLPNEKVDRNKLGAGSLGLPDELSGIMQSPNDIQFLEAGDVALVKGETWYNNKRGGLVHRSPPIANDQQRLILTLDFID